MFISDDCATMGKMVGAKAAWSNLEMETLKQDSIG